MASGVTVTKDLTQRLERAVGALVTHRVMVGWPAETALRQPEPGEKSGPPNNAFLAYIHNNGSPAANIPARPTLYPGIKKAQPEITRRLEAIAAAGLSGQVVSMDRALTGIGLVAQAAVRKEFTEGVFAPLKPATLAARKRRGFKGTRILIVTSQLRNAVNFVIRRRGQS